MEERGGAVEEDNPGAESWVVMSASPTDLSGDGATVTGWDTGVGTVDVDPECGSTTAFSTFVVGDAELVHRFERGPQADGSVAGAADVSVTPSILFTVVTLGGGVEGGAWGAAGVSATDTLFTGSFVTISADVDAAGAASAETSGGVAQVFGSAGDSGAGPKTDAVDVSGEVGRGVEGLREELVAVGAHAGADCVGAGERLVAGTVWVTVGAQVPVAGGEGACSTEAVPVLTAAAHDT